MTTDEEIPVDPFADEPRPRWPRSAPARPSTGDASRHTCGPSCRADLDLSGPFEVLQFPNGAANLTYLIRFGDTELVLRRPPFGTIAPGAHDMKREHKVLSRLWEFFDKAPRAYLFCDDHDIAGSDFFVMERRRGEVVRGVIPESMRDLPDVGHRMGLALVDAIAEFHLLDPEACGLGDLGRPDGFVERQVGRLEEALGPGRRPGQRRPDDGHPRPARRVDAREPAGLVRAQRPEARQRHVRDRQSRPGRRVLRLGHDHPRRPPHRPRHPAELLARTPTTPTRSAGRATTA